MPTLQDINYHKSVVYIDEHNEDGAIGLIINKPIDLTVNNLLEHMGIPTSPHVVLSQHVFIGGPVAQDQGFVLHTSNPANELVISTSKTILSDIADGNGPSDFIITLGYSGWEPNQLEKEVINNDWLIAPCDNDIILRTPVEKRWQFAAKSLGVNINQLTSHY